MELKTCTTCGEEKLIKGFAREFSFKLKVYYYRGSCKECRKIYQRDERKEYRKQRYLAMKSYYIEKNKINRQTAKGKEAHRKHQALYNKNNPEKKLAHLMVRKALQEGQIIKPNKCSYPMCDKEKIEAHHLNYSKQLDVTWLCKPHHHIADMVMRMFYKYKLTSA